MARVSPLDPGDLPEFAAEFEGLKGILGFIPNSFLTMARRPEIAAAFGGLIKAILAAGEVPTEFKQVIGFVSSNAAGCRYCQAHNGGSISRMGAQARVEAAFDYKESALFSDAERAALDLAAHASIIPNAATSAHFEALRKHWSDSQVVEICSVIALFGYLNRWNDTLATDLEAQAVEYATESLAKFGWEGTKHGA